MGGFRVPRFYYAPLKFYLVTKKDTWEQHPANLIPPLTTKHDPALSIDGTPSLARCRDTSMRCEVGSARAPKGFPWWTAGMKIDPRVPTVIL